MKPPLPIQHGSYSQIVKVILLDGYETYARYCYSQTMPNYWTTDVNGLSRDKEITVISWEHLPTFKCPTLIYCLQDNLLSIKTWYSETVYGRVGNLGWKRVRYVKPENAEGYWVQRPDVPIGREEKELIILEWMSLEAYYRMYNKIHEDTFPPPMRNVSGFGGAAVKEFQKAYTNDLRYVTISYHDGTKRDLVIKEEDVKILVQAFLENKQSFSCTTYFSEDEFPRQFACRMQDVKEIS